MSDVGDMRRMIAAATAEAFTRVADDPAAMKRCEADSDAIIAAVHGVGSSGACRAETWLSIAMTLAAIAVMSGREAPVATTPSDQREAALGVLDAVAKMTSDVASSLMDKPEGAAHAVTH